MNMWFQNSLLWRKSANTKSTSLRLMLERLHIKFEWGMEDREISIWLVLNILRTFPSCHLATGIKLTVRVLLCSVSLSLSLCVYVYLYIYICLYICIYYTLENYQISMVAVAEIWTFIQSLGCLLAAWWGISPLAQGGLTWFVLYHHEHRSYTR